MAVQKAKKKTVAKKTTDAAIKAAAPAEKATKSVFSALPTNDFFKEIPMIKGNKQFDKLTQGAAVMGQDQMDAMMKSSAILQKGIEEIIKTASQIAQEAGEKNAAATKALFSCKTLNEFADTQSKLAQTSYDTFLTNATKLSELSVKICTDTFAPINDQVGKTIKKASDIAA